MTHVSERLQNALRLSSTWHYAAILISLLLALPYLSGASTLAYGNFGARDFIQYWSAYQLFLENKNLYDPTLMKGLQEPLGVSGFPVMMWTAPWTVVYLAPILHFDFSSAARLWCAVNIVVGLSGIKILSNIIDSGRPLLASTIAALACSFPVWICLQEGQLGIFLFFFLTLSIHFSFRNQFFLTGLCLAPLTLKPHLFFLVGIAVLWWSIRYRNYRIIWGALAGLLASVAVTALVFPAIFDFYPFAVKSPELKDTPSILDWTSATLPSVMRLLFDSYPPLFLALVPGLSAIVFAIYLMNRRPDIPLPVLACRCVAPSLFLSPYGWVFDQVALLVPLTLALSLTCFSAKITNDRLALMAGFSAVAVASWLMFGLGFQLMHYYTWIAGSVWLLTEVTVRKYQTQLAVLTQPQVAAHGKHNL